MNSIPYPHSQILSLSGWLNIQFSKDNSFQNSFCLVDDSQFNVFRDDSYNNLLYQIKLTKDLIFEQVSERFLIKKTSGEILIRSICSNSEIANKWISIMKVISTSDNNRSLDDFRIISVIGRGLFGKVLLVQHLETFEIYAIKSIQKKILIDSGRPQTIIAERNILMYIKHPFIIQLHFAFQTEANFYLGLEYAPGGELFHHLQTYGPVKIENARIYLAELSLAINHLHNIGIVYRDLKPENILLDADGHIKLTDFGLAKDLFEDDLTTNTFCGTNHYLAPEIILRKPYSFEIDWWALGVLLCELITGNEPFLGDNTKEIFTSIINDIPYVPFTVPKDARDLIFKLLTKDPSKRPNFEYIKNHPFFKPLNWDLVLQKQYNPTFIPSCENYGLLNFESDFTDEPPIDSAKSQCDDLLNVEGFSFNSSAPLDYFGSEPINLDSSLFEQYK